MAVGAQPIMLPSRATVDLSHIFDTLQCKSICLPVNVCRAEAVAAAASGGTQSAAGVPLGQTDVTEPARLLVATVKGLKVGIVCCLLDS